ncbi:MAG: hypothetical protein V3U11_11820, partial [Planctomycetota bacterium]
NLGVFLERHREPAEAFAALTEAQDLLLELVDEQANDFQVINQLSGARTCLSRLHAQRGEAAEARKLVMQSLAHQNWMLGTARGDPMVLRCLCMTYASALDTLGIIGGSDGDEADEGDDEPDTETLQFVAHMHKCVAALSNSKHPTVMDREIVLKAGLWLAQWYMEHGQHQTVDSLWPSLRVWAQQAQGQRVLRHWRTLDGFVQLRDGQPEAALASFRVAVAAMAEDPPPRHWLHLQALLGLGLAELPDDAAAARAARAEAEKLQVSLPGSATRSWPRGRKSFLRRVSRRLAAGLDGSPSEAGARKNSGR